MEKLGRFSGNVSYSEHVNYVYREADWEVDQDVIEEKGI